MRLRTRCILDPQTRPANVRAYTGDLLDLERLRCRVTARGLRTAFLGKNKPQEKMMLFVWTRKASRDHHTEVKIKPASGSAWREE